MCVCVCVLGGLALPLVHGPMMAPSMYTLSAKYHLKLCTHSQAKTPCKWQTPKPIYKIMIRNLNTF